ncbi:MAG: CRISPR-associated endonuclease Cas2 [Xanthomonadaceae bacterium]|jgi:CRISPR-associated protein Cas2|nr:CRISPR-associated endonuclease Cas2 [Xanthomonadaceae bacterium]
MLVIVCYDVSTESSAGRRRLRRVAKVCESMGQRVQKSVFECRLDLAKFEALERRLLREVDLDEDGLRFYRVSGRYELSVTQHGRFRATDFEDGSLVV